jgi:hypothetical protein
VVGAAFVVTALLPKERPSLGAAAFAVAGLGCSALLPLTISFAEKALAAMAGSVAGGLIAFYQVGYGPAAFGVGALREWAGLSLGGILGWTAAAALALAALAFAVVRGAGAPLPKQKGEPS